MEKQVTSSSVSVYMLLCDAFSANYSCLRVANQETPFNKPAQVSTYKDAFKRKSLKTGWIDEKMKKLAENRLEIFNKLQNMFDMSFADFDVEAELSKAKSDLMERFNKLYKTNKTFEECFDGFEILDPVFKKDFEEFDKYSKLQPNKPGLSFLISFYYGYIGFLKDRVSYYAFVDIFSTLQQDLNPNGYRSLNFGKPVNPNVSILSREELEILKLQFFEYMQANEAQIKQLNRDIASLNKQHKKDILNNDIVNEIFDKDFLLKECLIKKSKFESLSEFVTILISRFEHTNVDYDTSFGTVLSEAFFDFSSGVNVFAKNNFLQLNGTYIHQLERAYLNHSLKDLGINFTADSLSQGKQLI